MQREPIVTDPTIPSAAFRKHPRISLVWVVPLVALLAAGWLGYRALAERGTLVEITFESAEGLEASKTKIKHHDIELGTVESLTPSADLSSVTVEARMNRFAKDHLLKGTRFWVVRPRLSLEGVSGLGTLISGSYIEMDPGGGVPARHFAGLEEPPVVTTGVSGTKFTLYAARIGSVGQGSPVTYRGIRVGEILGYQLSDANGSATVQIFIRSPHDKLVREGTRFWNASGISLDVGSEGVRLRTESVEAVLGGGIAFEVPTGGEPGPLAKPLCEIACNSDPLRGAFRVQNRPL